ncbi:MAG: glutamyl-tRNA amidotransferase [Clostridia bacterium]|nr:glutamyl-tRNA amidotransferase [Clostridia bacterium]
MKKTNIKKIYMIIVMVIAITSIFAVSIFAEENDPIQVINNMSDFLFTIVRAVGAIMIGFRVVQIGLSFKSHDPSQRANGFMTLAGGIIIMFAKEILNLIIQ